MYVAWLPVIFQLLAIRKRAIEDLLDLLDLAFPPELGEDAERCALKKPANRIRSHS